MPVSDVCVEGEPGMRGTPKFEPMLATELPRLPSHPDVVTGVFSSVFF